ncbi:MAG: 4Fe-4S dicluster domain-containing protein [Bryobacterales bacterium]|nr:4Fe-4S dicluster domain-containing protein [Bryobacterales bacterium]
MSRQLLSSICFGCGVCRPACPAEAIEMVPRSQEPEAAGLWL